ncbi:type II toxin-antitoxin system VapC family toxin [Bradyrhizobium sp. sBnM-33]|uniref:type II toxin-antitoxin system VapC family toxin n=1 Tax=Bradyrhizobium sp. sBnM-33 TaxID=2831780 RepID=UPI001BCE9132|nr:type II toxin-antitoxin system VapC family toxin [Bradyrhizobium sp. sBnM-33]WOH54375.1 type II toxin-antitoxin system VapC family toxin [Bradyrhizobium sp. sBnM-33]
MIAVDTSALMAVVLGESEADACIAALEAEEEIMISAATIAEALIVADRRNVGEEMESLIDGLGLNIISVSLASARRVARAYVQWGKGIHPAGLNLGDCFAYEVAKQHRCGLLYVGSDFAKTDIKRVL